jgi:hypothetical protein
MAKRLDENLGSVGFDNLINGIYPAAEVQTVTITSRQGVLKRGTVLYQSEHGGRVFPTRDQEYKARCVLAEDVDTNVDDAGSVNATAYRTGHFNANALITNDNHEITEDEKEELRMVGILISDAVEI